MPKCHKMPKCLHFWSGSSWSHQKWLWPQNGPIWALLAHLEGLWHLRWPLLIREMVSMHRPGHALTCCNLVPHSSTSLEQPDPLNSHTWTFWSFWTHLVHQIAPSAFKMKKGGGHIFQLSLICTLKAIEVIKKVKKRKKDWVTELWQINTLCDLKYRKRKSTQPKMLVDKMFSLKKSSNWLTTFSSCVLGNQRDHFGNNLLNFIIGSGIKLT